MSFRIRAVRITHAAALLLAAACTDPAPQAPLVIEEWRISEVPRVSIGAVEGDERYVFGWVGGATITQQGYIVVLDRTAKQLLFYDSTGAFVRSAGRGGRGPGEFQFPAVPTPYRGDSIAVYDLVLRRVSIFDGQGNHGREVTLEVTPPQRTADLRAAESCCVAYQAYSDGTFVLEYPEMIPTGSGPPRHGNQTLVRLSPEGRTLDTIGTFPGRYYYESGRDVRARRLSYGFFYQVTGATLFGGNGEQAALTRLATGGVVDTILLDLTQQPVTEVLKQALEHNYRAAYERNPKRFEGPPNSLWEGEFMSDVPAYAGIATDADGNLWLRAWQLPYSGEPVAYNVFNNSGKQIARIKIPSNSTLAAIRRSDVLLIEQDSMDVQYVRWYNVIRE